MTNFFRTTLSFPILLAAMAGAAMAAPAAVPQKQSLKIGFIGDSITIGYNQVGNTIVPGVSDVASLTIKKLSAPDGKTIANAGIPWGAYDKGVSGMTTSAWRPGPSDNLYGLTKTSFISTFGAPDPKSNPVWVFVMLGTNDVRSDQLLPAERHEANLRAIVRNLVASGFNVVINHAPSFVTPTSFNGVTWSASALQLLQSYIPGEKRIVHSYAVGAPERVFFGDTSAAAVFAKHPEFFQEYGGYGGLHPNGKGGTQALANCWAHAFRRILKP